LPGSRSISFPPHVLLTTDRLPRLTRTWRDDATRLFAHVSHQQLLRNYCTISFNSYVTHHGGQNIRKKSDLSRIIERMYEYPKPNRSVQNAAALSRMPILT
jgi:hypothetical protein